MLANGTNANAPKRMPKGGGEEMTKIIRVNSCANCDAYAKAKGMETFCNHPKIRDMWIVVDSYIRTKTLPDNCPLEEDVVKSNLPTLEERVRKNEDNYRDRNRKIWR